MMIDCAIFILLNDPEKKNMEKSLRFAEFFFFRAVHFLSDFFARFSMINGRFQVEKFTVE